MLFVSTALLAHSGRTDSCGGHNDRKRGGYHVHSHYKYCNCYPGGSGCAKKSNKKKVRKKKNRSVKKYKITGTSTHAIPAQHFAERYNLNIQRLYGSDNDKSQVIELQIKLKDLGYYTGTVDGLWGKQSVRALDKFQKDHNLAFGKNISDEFLAKIDNAWLIKVRPKTQRQNTELVDFETPPQSLSLASENVSQKQAPPSAAVAEDEGGSWWVYLLIAFLALGYLGRFK